MLARKNDKLAHFSHVVTREHGDVDHAGTHDTHGTRFSKHILDHQMIYNHSQNIRD